MHLLFACLLGLVLLIAPARAAGPEQRIGERVFLIPDDKANTVNFQMIVLAGCGDEANNDCRGVAHYLEHLVLVGRNPQLNDQAVRFFPDVVSNGWTTVKMTGYTHSFPASAPDLGARLDKLFGFYAARLSDFAITPEDAERERNVVRQEHDWRYGSSPYWPLWREAERFLVPDAPQGQPVGGTPADIGALSVEAARAFHGRWYKPNNVWFLVSGPIDGALLAPIVARHIGPLAMTGELPARPWLTERLTLTPASKAFRLADPRIGETTLSLTRVISIDEGDTLVALAAQRVINEYLASKIQGSPHSTLVETKELARTMQGVGLQRTGKGLWRFAIAATPEPETPEPVLEGEMRAWLADFSAHGLDEPTLARLKKRVTLQLERALANPQTAGGRITDWLATPMPYEKLDKVPAAVAALTLADVNRLIAALSAEGREATLTFAPAGAKP